MVEVGKFYNTEVKNLRATSLKVNDDGSSILKPLCSYWDNSSKVILLCEYIDNGCVIFREFTTSKIIYGVDDLHKTSTYYDAIREDNYNTMKENILNEKLLWIDKNNLHEIAKRDIVNNNIEASKSIDFLFKMAEDNLLRGFMNMCDISFNREPVKIKHLKKDS